MLGFPSPASSFSTLASGIFPIYPLSVPRPSGILRTRCVPNLLLSIPSDHRFSQLSPRAYLPNPICFLRDPQHAIRRTPGSRCPPSDLANLSAPRPPRIVDHAMVRVRISFVAIATLYMRSSWAVTSPPPRTLHIGSLRSATVHLRSNPNTQVLSICHPLWGWPAPVASAKFHQLVSSLFEIRRSMSQPISDLFSTRNGVATP